MADPNHDLSRIERRLDSIEKRLESNAATTQRVSDRLQRRLYSQLEALIGLYRDIDGQFSLPPLRNWAVSPDTARELVQLVGDRQPRCVVECGGGASTLLFAHLASVGQIGRIVTLEHDPMWYEVTRQRLARAELASFVDLRFAPLVATDHASAGTAWYDVDLDDLDEVEMVLVDGPPAPSGAFARSPAVPMLLPHCVAGCVFVIDDYIRDDEQAMVASWLDEYPLRLLHRTESVEKWLAVLEYIGSDVAAAADSGQDVSNEQP